MPPFGTISKKKEEYDIRLCGMLEEYSKGFIVHADNVGSKQFQDIRAALRPMETVIIMGKNTMMKRTIRAHAERTGIQTWLPMCDLLVGNVGCVFTKGDLSDVRDKIAEFKVGAPARSGAVAPVAVEIPAGNTGMDPSQTSFFQALNVATKINKGTVEILNDMVLISKGDIVNSSQAALLQKLNIKPFTYGLELVQIFESGNFFDPKVLDITDADMTASIGLGIRRIAALSMSTGYPCIAAVPHHIINGYKNMLAICLVTEYCFPLAEKLKAILSDPEALAAMLAASAGGGGGGGAKAAKAAEPEPEEEEEEEDMGFDLFG